mmetsp:Transcript_11791/g.20239  ORF Transcript_11791/g.20239 Transcript_11791/m.20239 type:complete len:114 (+) Transcript_11791:173-514(+)
MYTQMLSKEEEPFLASIEGLLKVALSRRVSSLSAFPIESPALRTYDTDDGPVGPAMHAPIELVLIRKPLVGDFASEWTGRSRLRADVVKRPSKKLDHAPLPSRSRKFQNESKS